MNLGDNNGWTPLHFAADSDAEESIRILCQSKANLNLLSNTG